MGDWLGRLVKTAITVLLIFILIVDAVYVIKIEDGSYRAEDWTNTGFVVDQKVFSDITTENITSTDEGWSLNIDLNAKVDEVIEMLEKEEGDLDKYISKDKQKEYLTSFIRAELVTRYPDLRSADKIGKESDENEINGCIQIQKALSDGDTKLLTYIDYKTFDSYITEGNSLATDHFTLDEDENILVAAWKRTTKNVTSNVPGVENVENKVEYELSAKDFDYKTMVSQITMPFDFLWALTVIGDDEDFAYEVSKLALKNKIVLTVQENFSITETTHIQEYDKQQKIIKSAKFTCQVDELYNMKLYKDQVENTPVHYKTESRTKTETSSLKYCVTEADTWIYKYENTITNSIPDSIQTGVQPSYEDDEEYKLESDDKPKFFEKEINEKLEDYMIETFCDKDENIYEQKKKDGEIDGVATDLRYEKYSKKINQVTTYESTTTRNQYEEGTPLVTEKTEKDSEEENFVTLFVKSKVAKNNISSAAEWLFEILSNGPKTTEMTDLVRYLLYKATGIDYGVTEMDFQYFLSSDFIEGRGYVGNLAAYLLVFSHGYGYQAPQSEDGLFYKLYGDGKGWPTIGNADLQWKSNQESFSKPGKVMHKGNIIDVPNIKEYVNTNCLTRGGNAQYSNEEVSAMEIYIEKKIVDEIGEAVQLEKYDYILGETSGLNLSRQQIYPLVAIAYNFGHLPEINGKSFKEVYSEASELYEEFSPEHNMHVWDTWWCELGGGAAGHIPSRDAQFETYVKGVFDYGLSEYGPPFERTVYIYYTQEQIDRFDYAPRKTLIRTSENEIELFTTVQNSGEFTRENGPLITGYYTSTMGRTFTIVNQGKIDSPVDWAMKCNRAAATIIASGYSDETPEELVQYMNDHYIGNPIIPPTADYWKAYGLKRDTFITRHMEVPEYTEILSEHLRKGGYAAIWINNNESTYLGKSLEEWTTLYHWVAIIDYRVKDGVEQIVIADARGADWYDIDEFILGIDNMALISEQ